MSEVIDILTDQFYDELYEIWSESKGKPFTEHGFIMWQEGGEWTGSGIIEGETETNDPRVEGKIQLPQHPPDSANAISVHTHQMLSTKFSPADLLQMMPFSDQHKGTMKGVGILVDNMNGATLRVMERTEEGVNADSDATLEVYDEAHEIIEEWEQHAIDAEEARWRMKENLIPYAREHQEEIIFEEINISVSDGDGTVVN